MRENSETISGGARMIRAISVRDRLKNQAAASGKTFQEALTAYGLERTHVCKLEVAICDIKFG